MIDLQFYVIEEASGLKTRIDSNLNLGSIFKGTEKKVPIAIFNAGDETAITPQVSIEEYFQTGKNYLEAKQWKNLSLSKSSDFTTLLQVPDIPANSWMPGKDIYFEDFSQYSTAAGTKPDQNWIVWGGNEYVWEVTCFLC